jgi:hypothetical protein
MSDKQLKNKKSPYKTDQERGIKQIAVRLTKREYQALRDKAEKEFMTISAIVRKYIVKEIIEEEKLPKKEF